MERSETYLKIKELQQEFIKEYPIMNKRVWLVHFCKFFWITRRSIYKQDPEMFKSKKTKINRKKYNHKKFMNFILNNTFTDEN